MWLFENKNHFNFELILPSFLKVSKSIEKRMWDFETPLRQHPYVKPDILTKLEARNFTIDKLRELDVKELGHMIHHGREFVDYFSSHQSHKKSGTILQNFNFEVIKLIKTPILPNCHLPNCFFCTTVNFIIHCRMYLINSFFVIWSKWRKTKKSAVLFVCLFFQLRNFSHKFRANLN